MAYIGKKPAQVDVSLSAGSITAVEMAANSVLASEIAENAIGSSELANNAVTATHIPDNTITATHIPDGLIAATHLAADLITGAKIADDAIDSEHYTDGSIDTAHIADDAVTAAKLPDDVIDSEHYADGSIDTAHIADLNVTTAKIANNAITAAKLPDNVITATHIPNLGIATSHIADNAITAAKIPDDSITVTQLADDAVTSAKLDTNIAIGGTLGVTGVISPTTHIDMPDNAYLKIGTSDDLLIYHDASNSYIEDDGDGDLRLKGSTVRLQGTGGTNHLVGITSGATTLYHNNAAKLATASGGATVTGTLTATTLAGTLSTAAQTNITSLGTLTSLTSGPHLVNASSSAFGGSSVQGYNTDYLVDSGQGYTRHNSYHTGGSNHQFIVNATSSTSNAIALEINKDKKSTFKGDVDIDGNQLILDADADTSIRESADDYLIMKVGGTDLIKIDASGLGIGIRPAEMLDIQSASGDARIRLDAPSGSDTEVKFFNAGAAQYTIGHDDGTDNFVIGGANVDTPYVNVDKSGNVGIGTTDPATTLHMDASGGAVLRMQRISSNASNKLELSFDGSNGTIQSTGEMKLMQGGGIIRIYADSTQVGGLATANNNLTIKTFVDDKDILFNGYTGGSVFTALTLDMSDSGRAYFNSRVDASSFNGLAIKTWNTSNIIIGHTTTGSLSSANYNTAIGVTALDAITSGDENVALGYGAGGAIENGTKNIAIGSVSGSSITSGSNNIAIGSDSLKDGQTMSDNIAIGQNALNNTTGKDNIGIGSSAMFTNTSGTDNVAIGYESQYTGNGQDYNVSIGWKAMRDITDGQGNIGIGYDGGRAITTGDNNVAIGIYSMGGTNAKTGGNNTCVGGGSGNDLSSGGNNTFIGYNGGDTTSTGSNNTAIGYEAFGGNGANNTFVGSLSGASCGTDYNTGVGQQCLETCSGHYNTAMGWSTGEDLTGPQNTLIGAEAGRNATSIQECVYVGYAAGGVATPTGNYNTFIGAYAGKNSVAANHNVFIGYQTGLNLTTSSHGDNAGVGNYALGRVRGARNAALGYQAGYGADNGDSGDSVYIGYLAGLKVDGGNANVMIGSRAGLEMTSGDNNIIIGHYAGNYNNNMTTAITNVIIGNYCSTSASSGSYQVVLGYNTVGSGDDTLTFGRQTTDTTCSMGGTTWSNPSDERIKTNITTSTAGLSLINDLRPVTFKYKTKGTLPTTHRDYEKDSTERLRNDTVNTGFIAQEVKTVLDNHSEYTNDDLWGENDEGYQRVGPSALIPILVKAVQELKTENDALKARVTTLEG